MNIKSILNQYLNYAELMRNKPPVADITLYDDKTRESVVFPVIPAKLPEVGVTQKNEIFNGATQDINLIGYMALRTYSMNDFLLPINKKYSFIRPKGSDGKAIKEFIEPRMQQRKVMRLAVTFSDGTELLNMACTVNNFNYWYDKVGDMHATIEYLEYIYVNATTQSTTQTNNNLSG